MKNFILHSISILILFILILYVSDFAYTFIYQNSKPRNKLQYILKVENQDYDLVFLGSSRVANHIDTKIFDTLSSRKTINLGVLGASLNDNLLELKLLVHSNRIKNLVLQLDDSYQRTNSTTMVTAGAVPFLRNDIIKEHIKDNLDNFNKLYYLPYYRYAVNAHKIGFRESFFSLINRKPKIDPKIGYYPMYGNNLEQPLSLPKELVGKNPVFDKIADLCEEHNINLIMFVAPYCSSIKNIEYIDKLKQRCPEVIDFSRGYADDLFYNCGHLNHKGAQKFTKDLFLRINAMLK
ncbi:hypothetical protein N7U66_19250 [Lacinutrix neustonica]|uniref:Uncharacterized protein n=1 Tax=Lacinutrix neustonica TaxID=2980107 RepID=A0A9E8SDN9_9FLAO|nr:hypothetical protein [Lacinutrix neustonica]WAC01952.1 hypothetical protein N7U66_19250 [Lacinutrix neustonica]